MKKAMKITEWWVEYNFVNTKWGMRAMNIRIFHSEHEATEFVSTTTDGNLIEVAKI